jgi:two-component system alkaline phosphatase synthesis response regulator PhoP
MAAKRILIAEDDAPIRELVVHHLKREGFTTIEAADGPAALRYARESADLVVLDIGLPGLDGLEITRSLKREGRATPVIMLTARGDEIDKIVGLELGADDYISKPFSAREVVARVRAVLRRSGLKHEPGPRLSRFGRLEIDEAAREVRIDGVDIGLKPREFGLLRVLAENVGIAMSREALVQRAWGYDFDGDERTVDVHMRRLRMKLEEQYGLPTCFLTLHGFGYKFQPLAD